MSLTSTLSVFLPIAARQHGAPRGLLEGVQPHLRAAVQGGQVQLLPAEPRRVLPAPPLLPERPQRELPDAAAGRLQAQHQEQRECCDDWKGTVLTRAFGFAHF